MLKLEYNISPGVIELGHLLEKAVSAAVVHGYRAVASDGRESIEEILPGSRRVELPPEFAPAIEGRYHLCHEAEGAHCELELLRRADLFKAEQIEDYFEEKLDRTKLYEELKLFIVSSSSQLRSQCLDDAISRLGFLKGMRCDDNNFTSLLLLELTQTIVKFDKTGTIL